MFKNLTLRRVTSLSAFPASMLAMAAAHADGFTVPTAVTDAATSVGLVGAAVFTIAVGIKLYKWIKAAL